MLAYSRAEFFEGCTISSSYTIGFGPIFRLTHFLRDSILNDHLKERPTHLNKENTPHSGPSLIYNRFSQHVDSTNGRSLTSWNNELVS